MARVTNPERPRAPTLLRTVFARSPGTLTESLATGFNMQISYHGRNSRQDRLELMTEGGQEPDTQRFQNSSASRTLRSTSPIDCVVPSPDWTARCALRFRRATRLSPLARPPPLSLPLGCRDPVPSRGTRRNRMGRDGNSSPSNSRDFSAKIACALGFLESLLPYSTPAGDT